MSEQESNKEIIYERRAGDQRGIERHIQTIIVGISLALLAWVGLTLTQNVETMARVDEKVKNMEINLNELKREVKVATKDRYTWKDAQADQRALNYQLEALDTRITKIEAKCERCLTKQQRSGGP